VFVVVDEAVVPRGCDGCGASFRPWGYARERAIRDRGGRRRLVRPRRVRCRGCRVTHVLLPAYVASRRADSAPVILGALLAAAGGRGHRSIAAELSLPAGTVRGWLRRATANAEQTRAEAMRLSVELDPLLGQVCPSGSPLAGALEALGTAVAAARLRLGPSVGSPTAVAMVIGKSLLHPLRT
jgi:transposase-like protein